MRIVNGVKHLATGLLVAGSALLLADASHAQTSNFKRKVVIEEFTGTWCQYCPIGAWNMDSVEKRLGEHAVALAWHNADEMTIKPGGDLETYMHITGFPSATVNRAGVLENYYWYAQHPWYITARNEAMLTPVTDIRITNVAISGSNVNFDVEISPLLPIANMPKEDTCKYVVFVAMAEDEVIYDQHTTNGEILGDFHHQNVVRKIATNVLGDAITMGTKTPVASYPIKKHYTMTLVQGGKLDMTKLKVFVAQKSNLTSKGMYVQNADQTAYLGTLPETAPNTVWTVTPAPESEVDPATATPVIWSKQGNVAKVKMEYTIDNGSHWTEFAKDVTASPYMWTIPQDAYGQNVMIRIMDQADGTVRSESETFSVLAKAPATIFVSKPSQGEVLRPGAKYTIQFETSGEVAASRTISYTTDGVEWTKITTLSGSATSFVWTVPDMESQSVVVKVEDANNIVGVSGVFSILADGKILSVTVNNGNYPLPLNTMVETKWTTSGEITGPYKLEYSGNNGNSYTTLNSQIPLDAVSYEWKTPDSYVAQAMLRLTSGNGKVATVGPFAIGTPSSVKLEGIPTVSGIAPNFPNPFANTTTVNYQVAKAGEVTLVVRDLMGKDIVTLEKGVHQPGNYSTKFDASELAQGTYLVTLLVNGETYTRTVNVTR